MRGTFITFEGPEGSGKTTQIQALRDHLQGHGYAVLITREPGGTPIGDRVRDILLSPERGEMLPPTEFLLFSASRAQLVGQVIRPALESGAVVVSDRYADSTLAYQGYARQLDLSLLHMITGFATGDLWPDLTIYLDVPVEIGLARKRALEQHRPQEWNRLDREPLPFHERVRAGFLTMAATEPRRWLVLDATKPADEIAERIWQRVTELVGEKREVEA